MKLKIIPETKIIFGVGTITISLLMGFSHLGVIGLDISGITTAIVLLVLGAVILSETWIEDRLSLRKLSPVTAISLVVAMASFLMAFIILYIGHQQLPLQLRGVLGWLFLINAVIVAVELRA